LQSKLASSFIVPPDCDGSFASNPSFFVFFYYQVLYLVKITKYSISQGRQIFVDHIFLQYIWRRWWKSNL